MTTYSILSIGEDLEGISRDDLSTTIDVSADDVDSAIEAAGWCGTTFYRNDDKAIVVEDETYAEWCRDGMPKEAMNYLFGKNLA